jgi:hypothetical protein
VIAEMQAFAPEWLKGSTLRDCWFEPTFHKHVHQLCNGVQIHVDDPAYDHAAFRPWRLQALGFKAIRRLYPDYDLWRDFPYEYVFDKLAIDVINGGPGLREWVDDPRPGRSGWAGGSGQGSRRKAETATCSTEWLSTLPVILGGRPEDPDVIASRAPGTAPRLAPSYTAHWMVTASGQARGDRDKEGRIQPAPASRLSR